MTLYYQKLEKLKDFNLNQVLISNIDNFIASQPEYFRFSPLIFSKIFNLDKELSERIASFLIKEGILNVEYEISCPECSSDVISYSNINEIFNVEIECDICGENFKAEKEDIWIFLINKNPPRISEIKLNYSSPISLKNTSFLSNLLEFEDENFFEINREELEKHIESVLNAKTRDEKKKTLENLGEYLFNCVDKFKVVGRNLRTMTSELDLIIENNHTFHPFLRELGINFLIECKNWSKPVGVSEIRNFAGDMDLKRVKFGILISKKGITGTEYKDAKKVVSDYFKKGLTIIVLDLVDLNSIAKGINLITILREKYRQIQFKWS